MSKENLKEGKLRVIVKPNSGKNEILGVKGDVLRVAVKAPADKGKANIELVKFLSKHYKKKVRIRSGLTSKEKLLEIS